MQPAPNRNTTPLWRSEAAAHLGSWVIAIAFGILFYRLDQRFAARLPASLFRPAILWTLPWEYYLLVAPSIAWTVAATITGRPRALFGSQVFSLAAGMLGALYIGGLAPGDHVEQRPAAALMLSAALFWLVVLPAGCQLILTTKRALRGWRNSSVASSS